MAMVLDFAVVAAVVAAVAAAAALAVAVAFAVRDSLRSKLGIAPGGLRRGFGTQLQHHHERRLRAVDIRERKKRDNHAKILLGVAAIYLNQTSEKFREFFDSKLSEVYSDAPLKLEAARYGLGITVKKPSSDTEQV